MLLVATNTCASIYKSAGINTFKVVGRSLPQLANNAMTCHAIAMQNELNQPPSPEWASAPSLRYVQKPPAVCVLFCILMIVRDACARSHH